MPSGPPSRLTEGNLTDPLLVALAFGAGSVDAISYLGLGKVFTANMTGNIVLLGVALGGGAESTVVRSAISLVAFAAGVLAATLIAGSWRSGARIALGLEAVAQAALLAGWLASSAHPGSTLKALLVGASALAMGLQAGTVRAVSVTGISATYVTGTLAGLIAQLGTGAGSRRDRARRSLVVVALLVGAACAALLMVDARRAAAALPLAVTLLVILSTVYLIPPAPAVRGPE